MKNQFNKFEYFLICTLGLILLITILYIVPLESGRLIYEVY